MIMFSTPAALLRSSPTIKALYTASLLVVGNSSQTMHSILSCSGEKSTTPAPPACVLEDPSV